MVASPRAQLLQELALGFGVTGLSPTGLLAAVCSTVLIPMASIPDIALLGKWSSPIGVVSLSMLVVIVVFKFATSEIDPVRPLQQRRWNDVACWGF